MTYFAYLDEFGHIGPWQFVVKPRVAPRSAMRPLSKARRGSIPVGATLVVALFVSRNNVEQQNSAEIECSGAL